ncbi:hypothetical protein GGQ87_002027 [Brevundimonas alba]|uniref:Rap1a immunity protein domain-containing protein n=1 Tax=Brevundimonas alba TaxID=74314 RepID=A0A7X5YN87_9CAUL|nr:hypothetical protein [Brevundimonas alba]NJC41769.1 hypothetical protein [Brevundimonas alba]
MKSLTALISAAVLLSAAPAVAQELNLAPADRADLQCMALVAVMAGVAMEEGGDESASVQMAGMSGGLMYYLGRLEGRSPDVDWLAQLTAYLAKVEAEDFEAFAPRCSKELIEKGQALVDFGGKP